MWKRVVVPSSLSTSNNLKLLSSSRSWRISSTVTPNQSSHLLRVVVANRFLSYLSSSSGSSSTKPFLHQPSFDSDKSLKKRVEEMMPIVTGHEREELEAELEGRDILEINRPTGPFGTKESPAIVKSVYDKRIVGCPGGEGEDEHDVVWFWLEKGKPHECAVCSQYFTLEVVGPGGPPDGHGDDHQ